MSAEISQRLVGLRTIPTATDLPVLRRTLPPTSRPYTRVTRPHLRIASKRTIHPIRNPNRSPQQAPLPNPFRVWQGACCRASAGFPARLCSPPPQSALHERSPETRPTNSVAADSGPAMPGLDGSPRPSRWMDTMPSCQHHMPITGMWVMPITCPSRASRACDLAPITVC
jgi:hypothetical protein